MKFCLVSTSTKNTTGYSKVAYNLLRELVKVEGLEVFHYAFQYHPSNFPLRPAIQGVTTQEHKDFDYDKLHAFCKKHKFGKEDIVMIYNDIGVILNYMKSWCPPRLWVYLDTVCEGIPPALLKHLEEKTERIYVFAPHWKKVYDFKNVRVLEHGVDTEVFKAVETTALREKMKLPDDAIVFLNANRNSKRKRLDLTISAFIQLCKRNPDKPLYLLLLTVNEFGGWYDFQSLIYHECRKHDYFPASKRILIVDTGKIVMTDEAVNEFYALADIGVNTSTGEGYGLTALEHASLGKPQVLTHLPQYEDFMPSNAVAYADDIGEREYIEKTDYFGAYQPVFLARDVLTAMENALELRGKVEFKPKSWEEVCKDFVTELGLPPRPPRMTIEDRQETVELPTLTQG
jgi:glycosyltransferase involved in cell wall biosynthesis